MTVRCLLTRFTLQCFLLLAACALSTAQSEPVAPKPAGKTTTMPAAKSVAPKFAPLPISARWALSITIDPASNGRDFDLTSKFLRAAIQSNGGSVRAGTMQEDGVLTHDAAYKLTDVIVPEGLLATVWRNEQVKRVSEGAVVGDRFTTLRYTDKRGSQEPLIVTTDAAAKVVRHTKGNEPPRVEPMPTPITDVAALPWLFAGRSPPKTGMQLAITDGKSVKVATFDVMHDAVRIGTVSVNSIKLVRRRNDPDDAAISLWLRVEDCVPMRMTVGLNARYGASIDQVRESIPPVLHWQPLP
jgi:hypothetical protein